MDDCGDTLARHFAKFWAYTLAGTYLGPNCQLHCARQEEQSREAISARGRGDSTDSRRHSFLNGPQKRMKFTRCKAAAASARLEYPTRTRDTLH